MDLKVGGEIRVSNYSTRGWGHCVEDILWDYVAPHDAILRVSAMSNVYTLACLYSITGKYAYTKEYNLVNDPYEIFYIRVRLIEDVYGHLIDVYRIK